MSRIPVPAKASVAIPGLGALACCIAGWWSLAIVLVMAALLLLVLVLLDYPPIRDDIEAADGAVREHPAGRDPELERQVAAFVRELERL